ncbi:unnamed protein product [Acanthocheilonema viteae]|uniref:Uncharacterized protein n=1 Tax=Acanthocheilonema viteae TaxID=6277 RepID=A0A498SSR7_ACAVI|nr:unnamed protein product [Acanthocheilonema viteae]
MNILRLLFKSKQSHPKHAAAKQTDRGVNENKAAMNEAPKVSKAVAAMKAFAEQTSALGLEGLRDNFCKLRARGPHPNNLTFNAQKMNRTKCRYHGMQMKVAKQLQHILNYHTIELLDYFTAALLNYYIAALPHY